MLYLAVLIYFCPYINIDPIYIYPSVRIRKSKQ